LLRAEALAMTKKKDKKVIAKRGLISKDVGRR
jgi:hypothetical protein